MATLIIQEIRSGRKGKCCFLEWPQSRKIYKLFSFADSTGTDEWVRYIFVNIFGKCCASVRKFHHDLFSAYATSQQKKTFLTSIFLSIDDNSVFSPFVRAQNACNNTWKMEIFSCKGPNQGCYTFLNETMATYLEIFGDFILQGVGFSVDQWLARKSSLFQFVQWYFIFWLFKALLVVWCLILFLKL